MAKRTNKTDHLLNLLAGGESQTEDKQSPGESKEDGKGDGGNSQEAVSTAQPEEATIGREQNDKDTAHSDVAEAGADSVTPVKAAAMDTKIAPGNVHVVRAIGSEDPIAELIREDLEKELEAIPSAAETEPPEEVAGSQRNEATGEIVAPEPEAAAEEIADPEQEEAAEEIVVSERVEGIEEVAAPEQDEAVKETAASKQDGTAEEIVAPRQNEIVEEMEEPHLRAVPGEGTGTQEPADIVSEPESASEVDLEQTATGDENEKEASSMAKAAAMAEEAALRIIRDGEDADQMHGHVFFNMMEKIVWEKAPEFMSKFGVCTCSRCKADTIALALSKLPPKYVVAEETAISPLLSFYEDHYAGQITVEITKACIAVSANPRHKKK